jgi:hypothetical protein
MEAYFTDNLGIPVEKYVPTIGNMWCNQQYEGQLELSKKLITRPHHLRAGYRLYWDEHTPFKTFTYIPKLCIKEVKGEWALLQTGDAYKLHNVYLILYWPRFQVTADEVDQIQEDQTPTPVAPPSTPHHTCSPSAPPPEDEFQPGLYVVEDSDTENEEDMVQYISEDMVQYNLRTIPTRMFLLEGMTLDQWKNVPNISQEGALELFSFPKMCEYPVKNLAMEKAVDNLLNGISTSNQKNCVIL